MIGSRHTPAAHSRNHPLFAAAVRTSHAACRRWTRVAAGPAAAATAAGATEAVAAAQSVKDLLTRRSYAPPRFVGPITVTSIPGKRYGITATENLSVGQLLLVVPPLAAVFGAAGSAPSNADLVQVLQGQQLAPWQLQWLRALDRHPAAADDLPAAESTSPAAPALAAADPRLLDQLQQLLQQGGSSSSSSDGPGPDEPLAVASVLNPLAGEQLLQVVAENAFSVAAEDLGASLLRELDPESVAGLWPEYALLNHSCQPNTTAVVIGRFLLLRAVAPVLAGQELTASYLGSRGLAPVAARRAFLLGVYGFHCQCERCLAEQATFPTTYYPADNALLGVVDPQQPGSGSGSNGSSSGGTQGLLPRVLKALRLPGAAAGSSHQQQPPQPSPQHRLLLELYTEATEALPAAVQEAVAADSARLERQLALLQDLVAKSDAMLGAVATAAPQLQQRMQLASPQVGAAWLAAAAFPLLQLQVELIELLLASGQLLVDERVLLQQDSPPAGSRAMAAAGAAAAARLSLARRAGAGGQAGRRGSRQQQRAAASGLQSLLAGLGLAGTGAAGDGDGPVTKRQLLALYADSLEACLQVADAVARGSEVHVGLALKHMDAVRSLRGGNAPETRLAEGLCSRAHAARYGVVGRGEGQQLLAALVSARRRRQLGASLSQKMSVLAWEASVARD